MAKLQLDFKATLCSLYILGVLEPPTVKLNSLVNMLHSKLLWIAIHVHLLLL